MTRAEMLQMYPFLDPTQLGMYDTPNISTSNGMYAVDANGNIIDASTGLPFPQGSNPSDAYITNTDTGVTTPVGTLPGYGEEGGGDEGGGGSFNFPPATYQPSPTDEEMYFMSQFGGAGYQNYVNNIISQGYDNLPNIYRYILQEAYANPDTSMFQYPEATLAKVANLGQNVKDYYASINPTVQANWAKYTQPQIEEQFAGPGYWGTPRAQAVSSSQEDLQRAMDLQLAAQYADAQQKGTLLDFQARLGIDSAKMNYLANLANDEIQKRVTGLSGIETSRTNALTSLLSQEPNMAAAVAALSRKFVTPEMNPEYMAAVNLATSMLGTPAFQTAGWTNQPDPTWSNLMTGVGTALGTGLAKNIPSWFSGSSPTDTGWTPQTVDLNSFNFSPSSSATIGSGSIPNYFGSSYGYTNPTSALTYNNSYFGNQISPTLSQMYNTGSYNNYSSIPAATQQAIDNPYDPFAYGVDQVY